MALQAINLPSINGSYELRLSVGIDAGVSDDLKLSVLNSGNESSVYRSMIAFIATSNYFDSWGLRAKQCLAAAVTGICQAKLIRSRGIGSDVSNVHLTDLQDNIRIQLMHLIGHWCSTLYILSRAGVEGLRVTAPAWGNVPLHPIEFSDDTRLRFSSFPAGTHRLAVAYEGAKKLIANRISKLCPDAGNLANLVSFKTIVESNRAQHHVGALYLCNRKATEYSDAQIEQYLGRIGTFIRVFFSTTTLCQSPHLTQLKVGGYEDYSIDWFNSCNSFKLNERSNQEALAALIEGAANPIPDDEVDRLRGQFFLRERV